MCVSCSWNEEPEYSKSMKAYYQIHSDLKDSISNGDILSSSAILPDSFKCNIQIDGKLIVDGGSYMDITDTYVTVEEVTIRVWIDESDDAIIYQPELDKKIAEPEEVLEWETMPEGINYTRKALTAEPVTITYKNCFYAEVAVFYILRIRDTYLASACSADRYSNTISCGSDDQTGNQISILVPLELKTIRFNAVVVGDN